MKITVACASWIQEADETVITALQTSDRWLSAAELAEKTGLPSHRVRRTLTLLRQQKQFSEMRKNFFHQ